MLDYRVEQFFLLQPRKLILDHVAFVIESQRMGIVQTSQRLDDLGSKLLKPIAMHANAAGLRNGSLDQFTRLLEPVVGLREVNCSSHSRKCIWLKAGIVQQVNRRGRSIVSGIGYHSLNMFQIVVGDFLNRSRFRVHDPAATNRQHR